MTFALFLPQPASDRITTDGIVVMTGGRGRGDRGADRHMMALLRSALFVLVFYPGTVIAVLIGFPLVVFGDDALRKHAMIWAGFHRWCCRWILGIRARVVGTVPAGPHLYAAKH